MAKHRDISIEKQIAILSSTGALPRGQNIQKVEQEEQIQVLADVSRRARPVTLLAHAGDRQRLLPFNGRHVEPPVSEQIMATMRQSQTLGPGHS